MKATKPATLGTLEFDAIISRTESMESEIPSYATEDGYSASDNICLKPVTLDIEGVLSNAPVTWAKEHTPSASRVEMVCEEFRKLWMSRAIVTFTAGGDVYENMCIESISLPRKVEYGCDVHVPMTLKQITVTKTDIVNINIKYVRGGKTKQNTGSGQSKASSTKSSATETESKSSLLCSGAKAIGLLK